MRIRPRYRLTILGTLTLVGLCLVGVSFFEGRQFTGQVRHATSDEMEASLRRQLDANATTTAEILASMLAKPLYRFELDIVRDLITPIAALPNVASIHVTDTYGTVLHDGSSNLEQYGETLDNAHVHTALANMTTGSSGFEQELFHSAQPILIGGELIGVVLISFRTDQFRSDIERMDGSLGQIIDASTRSELVKLVATSLALVVISIFIADLVSRGMTRPILQLAEMSKRIGRGEFTSDFKLSRTDEFGDLAAAMQNMSSELRQAHTDLVLAKDESDRANRSKSEFLANISHELRTPLNAIIGFADLLTSEADGALGDERYREYTKTILDNGHELLSMINLIIEYSRPDAGRANLKVASLVADDVVSQAVDAVRARAEQAGVSLLAEVPEGLPQFWGDEACVARMLNCILMNGIKFTPSGGRVRIEASMVDGKLLLRTTDSGIGMLPQDIQRALEPLTQLDGSRSRRQGGIGLGLPLAKKLAEIQGGHLQVESQVGAGTTITIALPTDKTALAAA